MAKGADTWTDERLRRVIDVSKSSKNPVDLEESTVREIYQRFGQINIYPWHSNARKNHFYVEFQSQEGCDLARNADIPGVNPAATLNDIQHRKRLISLSNSASKLSNHRFSPYESRSVSTSRASLPVAVDQGGNGSPQDGHQTHPQPYRSSFPYDEWPESLDNGVQSIPQTLPPIRLTSPTSERQAAAETIDIPILGETVKFPANSASTSSGISALLRSTADHSIQIGSKGGGAFISPPPVLSTQNTPSSRSSELSVEEMLEVLSEVRNTKREEMGQDASMLSSTSTRPPRQVQIHPKFDFRRHITSGRFLKTGDHPNSPGKNVEDQTFQLTPLQAYFADIYGSLQTELHHTKRRHKADLLLLEKQRILTEQYKQEAADERTARRDAERAVGVLQEQCERADALATSHQFTAQKVEENLQGVEGELTRLKAALAQIGMVYAESVADGVKP